MSAPSATSNSPQASMQTQQQEQEQEQNQQQTMEEQASAMKMLNLFPLIRKVLSYVYDLWFGRVDGVEDRLRALAEDVKIKDEEHRRRLNDIQLQLESLQAGPSKVHKPAEERLINERQKPELKTGKGEDKKESQKLPEPPSRLPEHQYLAIVNPAIDAIKVDYLDEEIESAFNELWSCIEFGISQWNIPDSATSATIVGKGNKDKSRPRSPSDKNRGPFLISILADILHREIFCNGIDSHLTMPEKIGVMRSEQSGKRDTIRPETATEVQPEAVVEKLEEILDLVLHESYREELDLGTVVELALGCASLLRTAKGTYEWDQAGLRKGWREWGGREEKVVSIGKPVFAKGKKNLGNDTYTVFGAVMKLVTSGEKKGQWISISAARTASSWI